MKKEIAYLTVNEYSRPGRKLKEVLGIVIHWTAAPKQDEWQVREFFERRKIGADGYGSAHYIIGQSGNVLQVLPLDEVAYHCGSETYTDEARQRYGKYCDSNSSPNNCTIGVELCPVDAAGNFTTATISAAVELCVNLCLRTGLSADDITTHHDVVGWKNCPKLWTEKPQLLDAFRYSVDYELSRN